jgi:hypothetical protein
VTKTFYHQGDATNTAFGEFNDSIAKRGKPYRTEVYDASGNLALQEQTPENLR